MTTDFCWLTFPDLLFGDKRKYYVFFVDFRYHAFLYILTSLQAISTTERSLIPNIVYIMKVVLVSGATTATPERSFSMARRIKTWLWSTMKQRRFNSPSILKSSKPLVDKLPLVKVANEFVEKRPNRRNDFGLFTESDLKTR